MKQGKVALVGVYPPPVGGISIHIQRLCDALDERQISYTLYDNTRGDKDRAVVYTGSIEKWALTYLFTCREEVVHVHFLRWQVRIILSLLRLRGKRVIFTVHSMREDGSAMTGLKRLGVKLVNRLASAFIVVNPQFVERLQQYGIERKKIYYIPPFLPPAQKQPALSAEVADFLGEGNKLVMANGAVGNFYQGKDLYGVDLFLNLCEQISRQRRDVRFLFCVTHIVDQAYFAQLQQQVKERGLQDVFRFLLSPPEYHTLLRQASLFVRLTTSESYGISVYEALQAGVPVVASNVAPHPPQVVLFESGNQADLLEKVTKLLREGLDVSLEPLPDYAEQIIRLYQLDGRSPKEEEATQR